MVTLLAAGAAGFITYTFARIQARIAQSQRDIALDKLKFDLFERRYEIYQATKVLLEYMPFVTDLEKLDVTKVRALSVTIARQSGKLSRKYGNSAFNEQA